MNKTRLFLVIAISILVFTGYCITDSIQTKTKQERIKQSRDHTSGESDWVTEYNIRGLLVEK